LPLRLLRRDLTSSAISTPNCLRPFVGGCAFYTTASVLGAVASFPDISKDEAMTQNQLNRAVACATGETVGEISSRGFSSLPDDPYDCGFEPIDWDSLDQSRSVAVLPSRNLSRVAR
jgi:hypothetical protein